MTSVGSHRELNNMIREWGKKEGLHFFVLKSTTLKEHSKV